MQVTGDRAVSLAAGLGDQCGDYRAARGVREGDGDPRTAALSRTAGAVGLGKSVDDGDGLDLDEVVGREQCGDADECAWREQGDPEFRAGAGAAFLD